MSFWVIYSPIKANSLCYTMFLHQTYMCISLITQHFVNAWKPIKVSELPFYKCSLIYHNFSTIWAHKKIQEEKNILVTNVQLEMFWYFSGVHVQQRSFTCNKQHKLLLLQ